MTYNKSSATTVEITHAAGDYIGVILLQLSHNSVTEADYCAWWRWFFYRTRQHVARSLHLAAVSQVKS